MKLEFSRQISEKYSNMKFQESPSSGRRVAPRGRTDVSTITVPDMTKLIDPFRSFANAPENKCEKPGI
jgi:hypothetical protein